MENRTGVGEILQQFQNYLQREEKSRATVEKYCRDAKAFLLFAGNGGITKDAALAYKQELIRQGYGVRSINSMLASVNSLLCFL